MIFTGRVERVENEEKNHIKYTLDTNDGGVVIIELEDQEEEPLFGDLLLTAFASNAKIENTVNDQKFKKKGDRYFTGHCYYQNGFVAIRLKAENHYIVDSDRNLKKDYIKIKECSGMFVYCDNEVTSTEWNRTKADEAGEYINCRIHITSHLGLIVKYNIKPCTKYYDVNSRVKLVKKATKDGVKGVYVKESMKWDF